MQRNRAGETGVDHDGTVMCGGGVSVQARGRGGPQSRTYCENAITMQHLILRPGPQLVMRAFRPEPDDTGSRVEELDFTGRAHELLFELITIHAETTLADIFRLMEASPLLQKFYHRDFAEELCAEARKGAAEPLARAPAWPPQGRTPECAARRFPVQRAAHEGIEFLELYQEWGLDTGTNEYSGMQHLHLHGIGHELAEDLPEEHRTKGECIEWSVSLTPLRELLSLPVRLKDEVRITEEDATAKAYTSEIRRARCADVTLGQVIHGLLWELSFHGGPQEQMEVSEDLKRQVAEVDAGTVELVSADDVFEPLYKPGCDALFEELGGRSTREIAAAIRDIDDDQNAAAWLDRVFGGAVVVKPQFRNRSGREFRKAFRAAGR